METRTFTGTKFSARKAGQFETVLLKLMNTPNRTLSRKASMLRLTIRYYDSDARTLDMTPEKALAVAGRLKFTTSNDQGIFLDVIRGESNEAIGLEGEYALIDIKRIDD